jgi:hypothetical protein
MAIQKGGKIAGAFRDRVSEKAMGFMNATYV